MKKLSAILFAALFAAVFVLSSVACAPSGGGEGEEKTVRQNGIVFLLSDDGASYSVKGLAEEKTELTIPAAVGGIPVTKIETSAFSGNKALKSVTLSENISEIGFYAFDNCESIETLVIPEGVLKIGYKAFSDCKSLSELVLPNSLEKISSTAFENCTGLSSVSFGDGLIEIGKDAFINCTEIEELRVGGIESVADVNYGNSYSSPIRYADKLIISGEYSEKLSVTGVDAITPYAFYGYLGCKELVISGDVMTIGTSAFSGCDSLESISLGGRLATVGVSAFYSCASLKDVYVGENVVSFGAFAFYLCNSIERVIVSDVAAWCNIDFYTDTETSSNPLRYAEKFFVDSEEISHLVIPEGVDRICTNAFFGFAAFKEVTIPKSCKVIEASAFHSCRGIERVNYAGTAKEFSGIYIMENNAALHNAEKVYLSDGE